MPRTPNREPDATALAAVDPLLTRQQAASYLTMSARFLDSETAAGRIAPLRLGRFVRYRVSELERYLDARAAESQADGLK